MKSFCVSTSQKTTLRDTITAPHQDPQAERLCAEATSSVRSGHAAWHDGKERATSVRIDFRRTWNLSHRAGLRTSCRSAHRENPAAGPYRYFFAIARARFRGGASHMLL